MFLKRSIYMILRIHFVIVDTGFFKKELLMKQKTIVAIGLLMLLQPIRGMMRLGLVNRALCTRPTPMMGKTPVQLPYDIDIHNFSPFKDVDIVHQNLVEASKKGDVSAAADFLQVDRLERLESDDLTLHQQEMLFLGETSRDELIKRIRETNLKIVNMALNRDGRTPLHYAVTLNDPKMVSLLLEHGASLVQKDLGGFNPVETAFLLKATKIIDVMIPEILRQNVLIDKKFLK